MDLTLWVNDPKEGHRPLEYHIHELVQSCPGADNVAKAVSFGLDMGKRRWSLYTEYCAYGNIWDFCDKVEARGEELPEAFLWMVFEKLVECGLIMQHGHLSDTTKEGWMQVVHRDLKPNNVFLDQAREDWPMYPQPKLGDFGLAFITTDRDELNPSLWRGPGTPGFWVRIPFRRILLDAITDFHAGPRAAFFCRPANKKASRLVPVARPYERVGHGCDHVSPDGPRQPPETTDVFASW